MYVYFHFRCWLPDLANDTYEVQGKWHAVKINQSIPWETHKDDSLIYSDCELYVTNDKTVYNNASVPENVTKEECHSWVYDQSTFKNTFITKVHPKELNPSLHWKALCWNSDILISNFFVGNTVYLRTDKLNLYGQHSISIFIKWSWRPQPWFCNSL